MMEAKLKTIADAVARSRDPVAAGRQVLLDAYKRTEGIRESDIRRAAVFELVRSAVMQAAYEATEGPPGFTEWPGNMVLPEEFAEASAVRQEYLRTGVRRFIADRFPERQRSELNRLRVALDIEANSTERFLGSTRMYVPGVGYAVSIRKRDALNQDSFMLAERKGAVMLGIADGCGSQVFASLASYMSVERAVQRSEMLFKNPKKEICGISDEIAGVVNAPDMHFSTNGHGGGASTLILGISKGNDRKVFRVGDSIGFRVFSPRGITPRVEVLKIVDGLHQVMGQTAHLYPNEVEEHASDGGQLILTSDGVTNYVDDAAKFILGIAKLTGNCVLMAERIVREVLKRQIEDNDADDATVIVQDVR
jgi:serine/threonine protein phosphatase PrpC